MKLIHIVFLGIFLWMSLSVNAQQKRIMNLDFNNIKLNRTIGSDFNDTKDSTINTSEDKAVFFSQDRGLSLPIIPYPIIFIHGINSNSNTWNDLTNYMDENYGFTYGGCIDFCLNYDKNNSKSINKFYTDSTTDGDIVLYNGAWKSGDYYYVNFEAGTDGSLSEDNVLSTQSSITKQGTAIAMAVKIVLQISGRDKVILVGHSMGGLAAREYVQNWVQEDGVHHVAKLATIGTPHGGSNQITGGVSLSGVDCQSEAYRDLRTSFSNSGDKGTYLFGGMENRSAMSLSFCDGFYNYDVNGNGIEGDQIIGLNQKSLPLNIYYSCVIGTGSSIGGDGCVGSKEANLNNYNSACKADTFILDKPFFGSTLWHVELVKQIIGNLRSLDEPNTYNLAYNIDFNKKYAGFITFPSNAPKSYDYDYYRFHLNSNSLININISNIPISSMVVRIMDNNNKLVGTIKNNLGLSYINFNQQLNSGDYYLVVCGVATSNSYEKCYNFELINLSENTGINASNLTEVFKIFPNPASDIIYVNGIKDKTTISLLKIDGNSIIRDVVEQNTILNISEIPSGLYAITLESKGLKVVSKIQIIH